MSYEGRRVLVTGGTGFVGTYIVEALLAAGAERFLAFGSSAGYPAAAHAVYQAQRLSSSTPRP